MALRVENTHELTVLLILHLLLGRLPARRLSKTCKRCSKLLETCPFCPCCYWPTESLSSQYWALGRLSKESTTWITSFPRDAQRDDKKPLA